MRAHVIENEIVVNTIEVARLDVFPGLVSAAAGGKIGDRYDAGTGTFTAPEAPRVVPARVTRRQARQALLLSGLLDLVQPAISAIPDPIQRAMAQIEWDDSQEFERKRPLVVSIGVALGLNAEALDELFILAGGL